MRFGILGILFAALATLMLWSRVARRHDEQPAHAVQSLPSAADGARSRVERPRKASPKAPAIRPVPGKPRDIGPWSSFDDLVEAVGLTDAERREVKKLDAEWQDAVNQSRDEASMDTVTQRRDEALAKILGPDRTRMLNEMRQAQLSDVGRALFTP